MVSVGRESVGICWELLRVVLELIWEELLSTELELIRLELLSAELELIRLELLSTELELRFPGRKITESIWATAYSQCWPSLP